MNAPSSSSSSGSGPVLQVQSQFLKNDENVLVLTKAKFFQTLRILLDYVQHPERRTWEFFSYRPWDYILGTYCLTFDLHDFAISCGPQHPCFCVRPLPSPANGVKQARLEYAQPDFTLMSHAFGTEGELLFLGEAKPMGPVEPDTVDAYRLATATFLQAEPQRLRQAKLAFERHSESNTINILMMSGSFWSVWPYERDRLHPPSSESGEGETDSQSLPPSPTGSDEHNVNALSPDRSPPHKIRRTDSTPPDDSRSSRFWRRRDRLTDRDHGTSDANNDLSSLSPVPSPPSDREDPTWRSKFEEEPLDIDVQWDIRPPARSKAGKKGKKGKEVLNARADARADSDTIAVHHILQLPNKDALNPWFRHFLKKTRDTLIGDDVKKGSVQSSWFDWPANEAPVGDGHAPGYVLPKAKELPDSDAQPDIVELIRVDEPPETVNAIDFPLNPRAANALMSPRLSLPPPSGRAGGNYTGPGPSRTPLPSNRFAHFGIEEDTVLPQLSGAESSDDEDGITPIPTDDNDDGDTPSPTEEDNDDDETTPSSTAEQPHPIPAPQQRQRNREPSPIDSYLARKRQDPPQPERQPDAAHPLPLPSQSLDDFASHDDGQVSTATTATGNGASAQTLNDGVPPVTSTLVLPSPASPAVAGGSRASTAESYAPTSSSSGTTRLSDKELLAARRRREKTWALLTGPLLVKKLPNGKRLPRGFHNMSRADQEVLLTLAVPRAPPGVERDYETAFRSTGMPGAQVRMMVTYVRGHHSALERSTGIAPPYGPSASRSHSGVGQRDPDESLTAEMPPPLPPTALPGSAEGALRRAGGDDAQSSGLRPVSGEGAGPSTTTTDVASRTHAGSRARAFDGPGAASSSSRSAGAGLDDGSHSFAEPAAGSSQAAIPPRRQRRGDPVATTSLCCNAIKTAHMETLNLGRQPSGTDPGEGSSNRKRKDRQ
ncbi:hypothetical protein V8D89_011400 [Ganoderma adspersum]